MPASHAIIAAALKIAIAVGTIMLVVPMLVWLERKYIADMQARIGPNRVGPFGLLQSFADGIKLLMKESIVPSGADKLLYFAAPVVCLIPALAVAAVVPFGGEWTVAGHTHHMVIADIPIGILFILALTSLGVYGIVLAGWSSNNKYSLLGGLRSSAQMVSYELPMGMSVVAGFLIATHASEGSLIDLSMRQVVATQDGGFWNWAAFNYKFLFLGFLAATTFLICGVAETNRAPFDLAEAETELIGGYHTEYGGMKWAMFFLGEYAAMLNVASLTITIFFGGWHAPYPEAFLTPGSLPYMLHGVAWFCLKSFLLMTFYIWLRGTLPRIRYDRLMDFAWKFLVPVTTANVLIVAGILTVFFPQQAPAVLMPPANAPNGPAGNAPASNAPAANAPAANAPTANSPGPAGSAPAPGTGLTAPSIRPPGNSPGGGQGGNTP